MAAATSIARRYATAYFDLAKEAGDIDGWRSELAAVVQAFGNPDVAEALVNPRLPLSERTQLGMKLLDGVAAPARNLARLLIERRRTALLPEIDAHFGTLADREAGVLRAEVITAVEVDRELERRISRELAQKLGQSVETTVHSDPSIVGGLVIRIGDRVIDDSVRTHLQQLQAALA